MAAQAYWGRRRGILIRTKGGEGRSDTLKPTEDPPTVFQGPTPSTESRYGWGMRGKGLLTGMPSTTRKARQKGAENPQATVTALFFALAVNSTLLYLDMSLPTNRQG